MTTELAATCGTCAHRNADGICQEPRSAWVGWDVARKKGDCYFYNRRPKEAQPLPRINAGLEAPPEGWE